jgi:hypothetical protein
MSGIYGIGKAIGSIFGLKEGGAVPVSLPEKRSPFMEALHRMNNMPKGTPLLRRKEGGAVPERTFSFSKWKEALSKHSFVPLPTPIRRKCGGCVKKTKGKKKGKDKK